MTWWQWKSYKHVVKRYFQFTSDEIRALILTIIIITFIVALNDGQPEFMFARWSLNFLVMLVIVATAVIVQQAGHRLTGIMGGFRVEYKIWWNGLVIGIVAALLTKGKFWVLAPGGIFIHHMAIHRLGYMRYQTNMLPLSFTALMGPMFNIFFAGIIKTITLWMPFIPISAALVNKIFFFNLVYAAYNLIPIPPLAGSRILFTSRLGYAFIFGCVASYAFLAWFGVYSYIYALLIGLIVYFLFFYFYERHAWKMI